MCRVPCATRHRARGALPLRAGAQAEARAAIAEARLQNDARHAAEERLARLQAMLDAAQAELGAARGAEEDAEELEGEVRTRVHCAPGALTTCGCMCMCAFASSRAARAWPLPSRPDPSPPHSPCVQRPSTPRPPPRESSHPPTVGGRSERRAARERGG
eukprot:7326151-Prymnesium_polylepis.1